MSTAPVDARVAAALKVVEVLTLRPDEFVAADLGAARAAGLSDDDIRDAALVCTIFSMITRLADTLDFAMPKSFAGAAESLTSKMGYRLPPPALLLPRV